MEKICIVAGDSGVYVGLVEGGCAALDADGLITMSRSRHLRRYTVMGRSGDGSVFDLAARGLDPSSASITGVVDTPARVGGVRRVIEVAEGAAPSFGLSK